MSILILAEDVDPSADAVVRALMDRSVVVHRLNTAWFPMQLSVSAQLREGRWAGQICTPRRAIELEEITAIWYRAPKAYRFPDELSSVERAHANVEAKYGLGGVLSSLPVLWVNHPARLADAAYKPVQLVIASRCGLTVPHTLITNEVKSVEAFAAEGRTVTKLFGTNSIIEEGVRKIAFTRLLSDSGIADLRGVEQTTHLFQRWVPKAYDARIVVIGEHLTSVAIRANSAIGKVDWRADYDNLSYELIEPPVKVTDAVRRLMVTMKLVYGALDFVVQTNGVWTFLEINAGGQYGWIEDETRVPLTDQLADLLSKGDE